MPGDRQQYRESMQHWQTLYEDGTFSAPATEPAYAILLPYNHAKPSHIDSFARMQQETAKLASHIKQRAKTTPEVATNATLADFKEILTDPSITHIVTIGRGTLSSIESTEGLITWADIAAQADHLKQGTFSQLQCGGTQKNLNPPLGMFAVADHRNVRARAHGYIANRANLCRVYDTLPPVTDEQHLTYRTVKEQFPFADKFDGASELVAAFDRLEAHIHRGTVIEALRRRVKSLT